MDESKKTSDVKTGDDFYHDYISYHGRQYWVDEVHDSEQFIGKWCINVEVPGTNHQAMIFTISVNEYDNEADNDALNIKRPALFNTIDDARLFCDEMNFPKEALRVTNLNSDLARRKIFQEVGAYIVKVSSIILPKRSIDFDKAMKDLRPAGYDDTKGIIIC